MSDPSPRRYDLDWIRIGAFFLLILYHVGMFYVPWDWHVKSPQPVAWLEPVMLLTNPWRLSLLFLVSGAATRFMADKLAPGVLVSQRTARLLPPLALGVLIIVPPQSYYEIVEQLGFAEGYLAFYGRYLTASGGWCDAEGCLITPTWNHLWFVAYLLIYTLALAALIAWARPVLRRLEAGVSSHVLSFSMFLFGYLTARSDTVRQRLISLRWPALVLALAAYGAFSLYAWTWREAVAEPAASLVLAMRFVYAVDQWCAIVAILGFGARHLNRPHPALAYLTLAVFPYYIVHQSVIVVAGHHLAQTGLPQGVEAALLIVVTIAACGLTYEIVRRVPLLRPWFGLKN